MDPFGGLLGPQPTGNPYTFANSTKPAWQSTRLAQAPMPGPVLRAPPTTLGQMVHDKVSSAVAPATGRRFANNLADLVDYTPVGAMTQAFQFGQDLRQGNVGGSIENGIGTALNMVPDGSVAGPMLHSMIAPLFHGSPHAFEKFALDKIGTGEGVQAYGHGLYFAENRETAKSYRDTLANNQLFVDGEKVGEIGALKGNPRGEAARLLALNYGHPNAALDYVDSSVAARKGGGYGLSDGEAEKVRGHIADLTGKQIETRPGGHLYQVSLDANPEDFLDWDKPLGQQPEKMAGLMQSGLSLYNEGRWFGPDKPYQAGFANWSNNGSFVRQKDGANAFEYGVGSPWDTPGLGSAKTLEEAQRLAPVTPRLKTQMELFSAGSLSHMAQAREAAKSAGIPGIRYLDQGSRGAANGTSNYVVFDPSIIDITHRF